MIARGTEGNLPIRAMVYRVRPDAVEGNKERIRAVLRSLEGAGVSGRYLSAEVDGSGTFVHVLDPEVAPVLSELPAFKAFQEGLRDILIDGPKAHDLDVVGGVGL